MENTAIENFILFNLLSLPEQIKFWHQLTVVKVARGSQSLISPPFFINQTFRIREGLNSGAKLHNFAYLQYLARENLKFASTEICS
jgi:hypothetical protein